MELSPTRRKNAKKIAAESDRQKTAG